MSEALDHEISTLQSIFWSERDPDGLAFAPLADAYLRRGEVRAALDLLTDGTSRHPDYATGHVVASRLYYGQGMHGEAELAARRVLQLDGENLVGLSILSSVLHERGEVEEASTLKEQLATIDPDSDEARAVAADSRAGTPDEAGSSLLEDLTLAAPSDETSPDLAEALESLGLSEEDDDTIGLEALAPVESDAGDATVEVVDLAMLAPERGDEPLDLAVLAPDADSSGEVDEVMDLEALAPDSLAEAPSEDVLDLSALAPDPEPRTEEREAVDLSALAPDPEPRTDEVMDLAALAPDPDPEPEVMDLSALAPDPKPGADEVMDLSALAPDPESQTDEVEVMDLSALAPDPDPEPEVMDLSALAPDPEPGTDEVMDLSALAPDAEAIPEIEVVDLSALAPEPEADEAAEPEEEPKMERSEPVYTRTLAELYVKQGFVAKALGVYRHLLRAQPDATDLRERIAELESGSAEAGSAGGSARGAPAPLPTPSEEPQGATGFDVDAGREAHDEAVETLARDLAGSGDAGHDVDTPFAWTDDEEPAPSDVASDGGPGIGEYFDHLLAWEDRGDS